MTDAIRNALAELVALKELRDRIDATKAANKGPAPVWTGHEAEDGADYDRRKPLAWAAARAALEAQPAQAEALSNDVIAKLIVERSQQPSGDGPSRSRQEKWPI